MRGTQKIKRVKLKISYDPQSVLFGIVSAEPDYKLSLALNRKLGISLRNVAQVVIPRNEPDSELTFSRFSYSSASTEMIYDLISNRSGNNCFMKKMKSIDYLFQVHNIDNESDINEILSLIRNIDCVTALFIIENDLLIKEKNLQYITH
jgi:hypothetical protein